MLTLDQIQEIEYFTDVIKHLLTLNNDAINIQQEITKSIARHQLNRFVQFMQLMNEGHLFPYEPISDAEAEYLHIQGLMIQGIAEGLIAPTTELANNDDDNDSIDQANLLAQQPVIQTQWHVKRRRMTTDEDTTAAPEEALVVATTVSHKRKR